jgi:hypothetical protein
LTHWHADLDAQKLGAGASIIVFSDHRPVRVIVADTLSIQSPDGQRSSAVVIEREGETIGLAAQDGTVCSLRLSLDQSFPSPEDHLDVFSRQTWIVH